MRSDSVYERVLRDVLRWAEQRCPCHNDEPSPCPLCGARVEPGGGSCLSAENTIPSTLLREIRKVLL